MLLLKKGDMVILESTSPVGTTEFIRSKVIKSRPELFEFQELVNFVYCPERVIPGNALKEMIQNDRIVGGLSVKSTRLAVEFYRTFVRGEIHITDAKTAEMVKLTENAFRDVNIAFSNELSIICDKIKVDVWSLISLANKHPRVNILHPGVGVGGHCLAIDPWFIIDGNKNLSNLIRKAREVNDFKAEWTFEKIKNAAFHFEFQNERKPILACMGITYKPDIDDLRESPALYITSKLVQEKFKVVVVEPNISSHEKLDIINYEEAKKIADIFVYLVGHKEFKNYDKNEALNFCEPNK